MALAVIVALMIFCGIFSRQGGADVLDSWWLRARFSGREWLENRRDAAQTSATTVEKKQNASRDTGIVIVEIDDKSLSVWPDEPLIMWGGHIADALDTLVRSGARLVALDWTQSVETDAKMRWNHDEKLGAALSRVPRVVLVKFVTPDGRYVLPAPSLLYSLPGAYLDGGDKYLGLGELETQNSVQTAFSARVRDAQKSEVTFAGRIAQNSGLRVPPGPAPRANGSSLIHFRSNAGRNRSGTSRGEQFDVPAPFEHISLADVALAKGKMLVFKDKIVLIGTTNKGSNDFHFVPFLSGLTGARQISGVEVQAHAVATLLAGDAIAEPPLGVLWVLSTSLGVLGVVVFAVRSWGRASRVLAGAALAWTALSFLGFCAFNFALPLLLPLASLLLGAGAMGGYRALSEERERTQVMKIWGRHQDPRLIAELLANPDWRGGQGRELCVTVLFADLKNFTQTVEHLAPAPSLEALNRYLSLLSTAILKHDGMVDKYLGDGLMAQWGAPNAREDHADAAMRACLEIEERVRELTAQLKRSGEVWFETRLTLHTGPVVAGPVGSQERLEYTLIGDTVNVTSRLQETAKELGCDFLISQTTCEALKTGVRTGRETTVEIRGRTQALRVFEVLEGRNGTHEIDGVNN